MYPQRQPVFEPPLSIKDTAEEARRRMESELAGLAAIERELDHLDRQLSDLRAQLILAPPQHE